MVITVKKMKKDIKKAWKNGIGIELDFCVMLPIRILRLENCSIFGIE